jgi:hypothetical protein
MHLVKFEMESAFAYYVPKWKPVFMSRNEVLISIPKNHE